MKMVQIYPVESDEVYEVYIEEVDNREIVQDGDDWVRRKKDTGEVVDRYSFDISNWREEELWGDYQSEENKEDLFLLKEGGEFVYGYEPAYRDIATGMLAMRRNRELTDSQRADARSTEACEEGIGRLKLLLREYFVGKHMPVVGEFCGI